MVKDNAALVIIGVLWQLPPNIVISGGQVWQVVGERISMVEQMIDNGGLYMVVSIVVNLESLPRNQNLDGSYLVPIWDKCVTLRTPGSPKASKRLRQG